MFADFGFITNSHENKTFVDLLCFLLRNLFGDAEVKVATFRILSIFPSWLDIIFEEVYWLNLFHFAVHVISTYEDDLLYTFSSIWVDEEIGRIIQLWCLPYIHEINPFVNIIQFCEVAIVLSCRCSIMAAWRMW